MKFVLFCIIFYVHAISMGPGVLQRNLSYFVLACCGPMGPGVCCNENCLIILYYLASCGHTVPMGPGVCVAMLQRIMSHF